MDKQGIRSMLSAYRAGESFEGQERFEEALRQAESDPELAQWWKNEQELDRQIAGKLSSLSVPENLRAHLLEPAPLPFPARPTWPRKIALLAAAVVLLAFFFSSWRGLFQPATALADYRDEMVSFVRLDPTLELETSQLARVQDFLKERSAPNDLKFPARLQRMEPVGCRTLRFRGQDVALVCFRRADGELVHLLAIRSEGMEKISGGPEAPTFAAAGEWMTASWRDSGMLYLLAAKGGHEAAAKYFGTS